MTGAYISHMNASVNEESQSYWQSCCNSGIMLDSQGRFLRTHRSISARFIIVWLLCCRRRGLLDPDFLQLLSHVLLGTVLSKIVPFIYGAKPALLKLGSTTRYSEITAAVKRDSLLAAVGFAALGLWLSLKIAAKFVAA